MVLHILENNRPLYGGHVVVSLRNDGHSGDNFVVQKRHQT